MRNDGHSPVRVGWFDQVSQRGDVIPIPRTSRPLEDIDSHHDEVVERSSEPNPGGHPEVLQLLHRAVAARAAADRDLASAITAARDASYSWSAIGALLGISGEAAWRRYAHLVTH